MCNASWSPIAGTHLTEFCRNESLKVKTWIKILYEDRKLWWCVKFIHILFIWCYFIWCYFSFRIPWLEGKAIFIFWLLFPTKFNFLRLLSKLISPEIGSFPIDKLESYSVLLFLHAFWPVSSNNFRIICLSDCTMLV